jgi:hypothetical protein
LSSRSAVTTLFDRVLFGVALLVQQAVLYVPRGVDDGVPYADKVVHVVIFAAVVWTGRRIRLSAVVLTLIFGTHAVVSELLQSTLFAERSGTVSDVIANLVGVAVGLALPTRGGIIRA